MSSKTFDIITKKSKEILLRKNLNYNSQGYSCVPYEEIIVSNSDYPENYFLVHKNMIFVTGLNDCSYDVFKFDKEGNFIDSGSYPRSFFRNMKVEKKI
jgi:hypothetical protein